MGKLGIDFGTSFSTLYAWDDEHQTDVPIQARTSSDRRCDPCKIPSVAFWDRKIGLLRYGIDAETAIATEVDAAYDKFYDGKDEESRKILDNVATSTVRGVKMEFKNSGATKVFVKADGEVVSVPVDDIVTGFFRYFKKLAEDRYFKAAGKPIAHVCVTHPVAFTPDVVERLVTCAKKAGLPDDIVTLEEPLAAAIAFDEHYNKTGKRVPEYLIYDLGGGTFDTAFAVRSGDRWSVPGSDAHEGLENCGGERFDTLLFNNWYKKDWTAKHPGLEIEEAMKATLRDNVFRKLKEDLSDSDPAYKEAPLDFQSRVRRFKLDRLTLETVIGDEIAVTVQMTKKVKDAVSKRYHPSAVILIGGSSRIPMVARLLKERLSLEVLSSQDGDTAVAHGAVLRLLKRDEAILIEDNEPDAPAPRRREPDEEAELKETRLPVGMCDSCKALVYPDEMFCRKCGHLLPSFQALSEDVKTETERRLRRAIAFDQKFELPEGFIATGTTRRLAKKALRWRHYLTSNESGLAGPQATHLAEKLDSFATKCSSADFQIAFVGTIKAGKSSLINAFLNDDFASTDVEPDTAVLTKFRSSPNGKYRIRVEWYSDSEWEAFWDGLQKLKTERPGDAERFLARYRKLDADKLRPSCIGKKPETFESHSKSEIQRKAKELTSSKSACHLFAKEVSLSIPGLDIPKNVTLVDTPGLDDPLSYRSDISRRYIRNAAAIILCINADGGATASAVNEFYKIADAQCGADFVYIAGTKIDNFKPDPNVAWAKVRNHWIELFTANQTGNDIQQKWTSSFKTRLDAQTHIIGVSAYDQSKLREIDDPNVYKELANFASMHFGYRAETDRDLSNLKEKIREFAQVEVLWNRIEDDVIKRRETIRNDKILREYESLKTEVLEFLGRFQNEQDRQLGSLNKSGVSLLNEIEKTSGQIRSIEDTIEEIQSRLNALSEEVEKSLTGLKIKF